MTSLLLIASSSTVNVAWRRNFKFHLCQRLFGSTFLNLDNYNKEQKRETCRPQYAATE